MEFSNIINTICEKWIGFCARFLTYIDYMVVSLLQIMLQKALETLSSIIKKHEMFGPNDIELNSSFLNVQIERKRPENYPQTPLLLVHMILKIDGIDCRPTK